MLSALNRSIIFILSGICLLLGCTAPQAPHTPKVAVRPDSTQRIGAAAAFNKHIIDTALSLLQSGDIVLRSGLGPDSYLLSQLNQKDKTFSHCGIVMIENGYPFVYHSIGGEDNPDERLRRDSAVFFFSPAHNIGLGIARYTMNAQQLQRLRTVVRNEYARRPRFDLKFDLATDDELYCTEFVYKSLCRTMNDKTYITPSHHLGKAYIGVDDLFINPHVRLVWKMGYK